MRRIPKPAAVLGPLAAMLMLAACTTGGQLESDATPTAPAAPVVQQGEPYTPQQVALLETVVDAGYVNVGIPRYNGTRYIVDAQVESCTGEVELGGSPGPETQDPSSLESFEVVSVDGAPAEEVLPQVGTRDWRASVLISKLDDPTDLGCSPHGP